ncbi:hypothetical protein QBC34DRAFT_490358 [Podospora aff. communis PSN243]|uniref:Adenylyltransferase and sulfurtransferase uba4 n=1 Tax=Podospora aff. communis PSN243 TaxID=3040156 RepID=A0AAV9H2G4_9PEZI|nr:hypothetical protein QBC34DRAFT_490358 [Podospora aff. communis PSN243]
MTKMDLRAPHEGLNGKNGHVEACDRRLTEDEFERYSRQMIVPGVGREGQLRLIYSRILIIGAGGLGCPAAQYVAGAGVGTIGIVDGDVVEISNLHRQVGHATSRLGMKKVDSLIAHLRDINPLPTYVPYTYPITPENAADIISEYDLVMDCTDNPATRYLISDMCVLLCKPLVSAASVKKSGQLIVLNCPPTPQGRVDGKYAPCYRCCFKKPPPPSSMVSCGEAGIMGTVVGLMGVAQAGEAIKILISSLHLPQTPTGDTPDQNLTQPTLLIYTYDLASAIGPYSFRPLKMSPRKKNCFACGENSPSTLTLEGIKSGTPNYEQFCSLPLSKHALPAEERISARAFHDMRENGEIGRHVLIDTREREHFSFGSIEGAVNVPFGRLLMKAAEVKRDGGDGKGVLPDSVDENAPVFVVCRRGLDSQEAVEKLKELGVGNGGRRRIMDIAGGIKAWKEEVDPTFPFV